MSGFWQRLKHDENFNETSYEDSTGFNSIKEYDKFQNLILYKDSNGFWIEYTYDKVGDQMIFVETSTGLKFNKELIRNIGKKNLLKK